jgi:hypothetical protein
LGVLASSLFTQQNKDQSTTPTTTNNNTAKQHQPRKAGAAIEFTWVDASGNVRVSARESPEGRALSGGLGLLGVITGAFEFFWGGVVLGVFLVWLK